MPAPLTYPGVYIEEIPSGVRTITGVATSITAFIGRTLKGPENDPKTINCYGDFERIFGGLWAESFLGFAVRDFFLNGGNQAIVVRLFHDPDPVGGVVPSTVAKFTVDGLKLMAASKGSWGGNLRVSVDVDVSEDAAKMLGLEKEDLFNMTIREDVPGGSRERFINLTVEESPRRIEKVLKEESKLMLWDGKWPSPVPDLPKINLAHEKAKQLSEKMNATPPNSDEIKKVKKELENANKALHDGVTKAMRELDDKRISKSSAEQNLEEAKRILEKAKNAKPPVPADITKAEEAYKKADEALKTANKELDDAKESLKSAKDSVSASDGKTLTKKDDFTKENFEYEKKGLYALEKADLFNILCIPPYDSDGSDMKYLVAEAAAYCEKRRAMLLVDPPIGWKDKEAATKGIPDIGTSSKNAALFFPRLTQPNPLRDNQMEDFVPCGAVAGIFARTDTQRGVWKAPAGLEATLVGVPQLSVPLTDPENGELNQLGINCLRSMPPAGRVVWGSRTLQGDDRLASEWKYIPVRRTALFIEESLYRGTKWVVFEPNDEPLWAQIRLNIGAFMHNLFRQGAFQGSTPREAYFVKCDKETTTQNDINLGIVNIIVGFAPLKPAEFVVIKIQQIAGQIQT